MWLLVSNTHEKMGGKKRMCIMQSGKNCAINCTIQGRCLIGKWKIWLVLTKPYCSLANLEFQCVICTGIALFALCNTWTAFEFKEITEVQNAHLQMLLENDEMWLRGCKYPTPPCALAKILPGTTLHA